MKAILCLLLAFLFICSTIAAQSRLFHTLNSALTPVLESTTFKQVYTSLGYSMDPMSADCVKSTYPRTLEKTQFRACHGADTDSLTFIESVRDGLETELSNRYGRSVTITLVPVNTGSSFFYFISTAVMENRCDFSIGMTVVDTNRAQVVDFICPFVKSSNVIVRGALDPEKEITEISDINQAGIRVSAVRGSSQATFLRTNAPLATIVTNSTVNSLFQDLQEQRVHALVTSDVNANRYLAADTSCTDCTTYPYGAFTRMAIFVPKENAASVIRSSTWILVTLVCTLLLL